MNNKIDLNELNKRIVYYADVDSKLLELYLEALNEESPKEQEDFNKDIYNDIYATLINVQNFIEDDEDNTFEMAVTREMNYLLGDFLEAYIDRVKNECPKDYLDFANHILVGIQCAYGYTKEEAELMGITDDDVVED